MSVLISFDVAMHGVRVTCGDYLLLPLRSRLAVEKKISVSLSQQEMRRLASSTVRQLLGASRSRLARLEESTV